MDDWVLDELVAAEELGDVMTEDDEVDSAADGEVDGEVDEGATTDDDVDVVFGLQAAAAADSAQAAARKRKYETFMAMNKCGSGGWIMEEV